MPEYRNILAAVDFSEHTDSVLQRAIVEAKKHSARLMVLHVVEHAWPTDIDVIPPSFDETEEKAIDAGMGRLNSLLTAYSDYPLEPLVVAGTPNREVINVAEREHADLIVLGSHGRHGLRGILGSTTDRIAHQAGCDVLIVRR
jgi:universal stress protein A